MERKDYQNLIRILKDSYKDENIKNTNLKSLKEIIDDYGKDLFGTFVDEAFKSDAQEKACNKIIQCAVETNCKEAIEILEENKVYGRLTSSKDDFYKNILKESINQENLSIAEHVLKKQENIIDGEHIVSVVKSKNLDMLNLLTKHKVDLNYNYEEEIPYNLYERNINNFNIVSCAVVQNDLDMVKALIEDFEVDLSKTGQLALKEVLRNENSEIRKVLVDNGARIDSTEVMSLLTSKEIDFGNAFEYAVCAGDIKLLEGLTSKYLYSSETDEIDTSKIKLGIIGLAIESDKIEVIEYFSEECNIDLNMQNEQGQTPLSIAAKENNAEIMECLVYHGADMEKAIELAKEHDLKEELATLEKFAKEQGIELKEPEVELEV